MNSTKGTHEFVADPRNDSILISVNGKLVPRAEATVSVFDSGFVLGDGVWEGMRLVGGGIPFLRAHVERLYEGARAIYMDIGLTPDALVSRIFACIDANRMTDGVHIRLMVTRGVKATPYQDPRLTIGPPTIVVIPEYKDPRPETSRRRAAAVHRQCPPRPSRRAGSEAQLAFEAQLHHRLHPGVHRRRR